MSNTPKARPGRNGPSPTVTDQAKSLAIELGMGPGTTMTGSEVFLLQRCAELDMRRQQQIQAQRDSITRLLGIIYGDPDEEDGVQVVFHYGSRVLQTGNAEVDLEGNVTINLINPSRSGDE